MRALRLDVIEVCPWALREGLILRRLVEQREASPGEPLDVLPSLVEGAGLAETRLIVASLDPDLGRSREEGGDG